jgi:hypothetical protein
MNERTALEIASRLEALIPIAGGLAVEALRRQHAEIERLKTVPMKYRRMAFNAQLQEENAQLSEKIERLTALNSTLTAKGNAFVIENARQAEKIDSLTKERDAVIARASALTHHLTQVIGEHYAPSDCYSSGPLLGDARDVVCPACEALRFLNNPREVGLMKKGI